MKPILVVLATAAVFVAGEAGATVYDFSSELQAAGVAPPGYVGPNHAYIVPLDLPAESRSIDIAIQFSGITVTPYLVASYRDHYAYSQPDPTGFYAGNEGNYDFDCNLSDGCLRQTSLTTISGRFTAPRGFGSWDACPSFNPSAVGQCYAWWTPLTGDLALYAIGDTITPGYDYDLCQDCTLRVTITPVGVPEPALWATLVVGFLGIGAALRARTARLPHFA